MNGIVGTAEVNSEALMRIYLERVVADGELDLIDELAHADMVDEATDMVSRAEPLRTAIKVGRNDPCPCGSGKKHKKCCG